MYLTADNYCETQVAPPYEVLTGMCPHYKEFVQHGLTFYRNSLYRKKCSLPDLTILYSFILSHAREFHKHP